MGLVINQPLGFGLEEIYNQLNVKTPEPLYKDAPVICGGPVQTDRGFVLHTPDQKWSSSFTISPELVLTSSQDIIHAISRGEGPDKFLVMLGYAGWSKGQLEAEMSDNAWLTAPSEPDIVFEVPIEQRWAAASKTIGINLDLISSVAGHA